MSEEKKRTRLTKVEVRVMDDIIQKIKDSGKFPPTYVDLVIKVYNSTPSNEAIDIDSAKFRQRVVWVYVRRVSDWGIVLAIRDLYMLIVWLGDLDKVKEFLS